MMADVAEALVGTRTLPAGWAAVREMALEARAYHANEPYPHYFFRDWKREERGPLPRCMPVAQRIVRRGAKWLFGQPPALACAANEAFEAQVQRAWRENRLGARLPAMAERAALEGGVALKFDYDSRRPRRKLGIDCLSLVDQARLYYDPHDMHTLLMARVQYPYLDAASGTTLWWREEWTAARRYVYEPLAAVALGLGVGAGQVDPDGFEAWTVARVEENLFGVIPVLHVKNVESDDAWGMGDLWTLYRTIDRINLSYHLMDRSNQFDSEVNPIFQDLEVRDDDLNARLAPGESIAVRSSEDGPDGGGKVYFPRGGNTLRPAMQEYAKDLRRMVNAAAGSVEVEPADVTNKGALTTAVLTQLYQPQIEMTNLKRQSWGECGLTALFALIAEGLTNAGVAGLGYDPEEPASCAVAVQWPSYFPLSEDEKAAVTARTQEQEAAGYVSHERAVERIALVEGVADVAGLKGELAGSVAPAQNGLPDEAEAMVEAVNSLRRVGGPGAR